MTRVGNSVRQKEIKGKKRRSMFSKYLTQIQIQDKFDSQCFDGSTHPKIVQTRGH